jgi:uncharacterized protein (TIGR02001 family)
VLACAGCALLLGARVALAQVGGTVTVESDYRFRGVSLGGNRPSARAGINYDAPDGWYAGGSAARAQYAPGYRYWQMALYGGRVVALSSALNLDMGASTWRFSSGNYSFAEAYAGLLAREWSVRLNYSPNYFHEGLKTLYLDANVHRLLTDDWRVFAHAGELVRVSHAAPSDPYEYWYGPAQPRPRTAWDVRAGLGWTATEALDLQLAWTRVRSDGPAPIIRRGGRRGWIASASWSF